MVLNPVIFDVPKHEHEHNHWNFWVYAAVSVLHVGSVSVGVASVRVRGFMAQEKKRPHLRLAWLVDPALCARGHWNRVFLRWPPLQLRFWAGALEVRCACSETAEVSVHAPTGRASRLVVRGLVDSPLRARRRTALWRVRGAISVAWWQRFTCRPEHPFVREAIPLLVNLNALRR